MARRAPSKFNQGSAPRDYVAGLGRGALGFTTRSDLGPGTARGRGTDSSSASGSGAVPGGLQAPDHPFGQAPSNYVAGAGRGSFGFGEAKRSAATEGERGDRGDYSDTNFDAFGGFKGSLFADKGQYGSDDREADRVWDAIEDRMDGRRKRRREEKQKEAVEKYRKERPKISDQFADLKQELGTVSAHDWDAIPEATSGVKHRKKEFHAPVSDSILASQMAKSGPSSLVAQLDERLQNQAGVQTPMSAVDNTGAASSVAGVATDIRGFSTARDKMLRMKLDGLSDSVAGQTVVDPTGYLTSLSSIKTSTPGAEVGDISKARLLLESVTKTNPKHGPGWIAFSRMEEVAGKMVRARQIIAEGCVACPKSEDVWLEAARLNNPPNAKVILARAVRQVPRSVKIWIAAADLEYNPATTARVSASANRVDSTGLSRRKAVLRRALEFLPNSLKLWQAAIELEGEDDAKIMLARAVECVPQAVELWLALAHLETFDQAKVVLNQARAALPAEPRVWVAAAQLNEVNAQEGYKDAVTQLIETAVRQLSHASAAFDRQAWLKLAEDTERAGSPHTCEAIVLATADLGIETADRKRTWTADAQTAQAGGFIIMARMFHTHLLATLPKHKHIWLTAVAFERRHGTQKRLLELLNKAVEHCPTAEILWLMAAKETWVSGDVAGAHAILERAFELHSDSEAIWLAAVKILWENDEVVKTRRMLKRARDRCPESKRVWLKSALFELECKDVTAAHVLLKEAITRFASFEKLWLMKGQLAEAEIISQSSTELVQAAVQAARAAYLKGLESCPQSVALWLHAARLEERYVSVVKSRSVLEVARVKNPASPMIWLEAVRLERRAGQAKMADAVMAKALQECPDAGILWAERIGMAPRPQQKAASNDALKHCENDAYVVVAVARLLWRRRKYDKARKWLDRAVTLAPDVGDAWAVYFKFELMQESGQTGADQSLAQQVAKRCVVADPHHGEVWCKLRKLTENRRLDTERVLGLVAAHVAGE